LKDAFDKHSLISQEVFKRLYPDNSPFSKVAGGSFKSVRKLNLDMVETFHIKNYRPGEDLLGTEYTMYFYKILFFRKYLPDYNWTSFVE